MKNNKLILTAIFLFALFCSNLIAQGDIELAKRYLKLSNSYRQVGEFSLGEQFADKAKAMLANNNSFDGKYWTAVSNEYLAFIYCDQGKTERAKSAILTAIDIYSKIIKQKNGSPAAAEEFLSQIEQFGCPCVSDSNSEQDPDDDTTARPGETNNIPMSGNSYNRDFTNNKPKKLKVFPSELPKTLINLSVAQNRIKDIPDLSKYEDLTFLDLSDNKIQDIPESVSEMKNLKYLILRNNNINDRSLDKLPKNLQVIDLRKNKKLTFTRIKMLIQDFPNALIYHDVFIRDPNEKL